jgi:Flp pilus assembly protein TadD/peroxiredoxin
VPVLACNIEAALRGNPRIVKPKSGNDVVSRRKFLRGMRWTPVLFLPAPLYASNLAPLLSSYGRESSLPLADSRLTPHYPSKSPLDEVLRLVAPGADEFVAEKYASEIGRLLEHWSRALRTSAPALDAVGSFLDPSIETGSWRSAQEKTLRSGPGLGISRRQFDSKMTAGREHFLTELKAYFDNWPRVETAAFEIVHLEEIADKPSRLRADIRYDFVAPPAAGAGREQRIGLWHTEWLRDEPNAWRALKWQAGEETVARARDPMFTDVTSGFVGQTESYRNQLSHGADYWRTVLDGACGIDVYGNQGLAVGDFDNDGLDDLYVCQPAGLPNRLFRNRGDGTLEDVTDQAGVGILDDTACALFADFENKGVQDLLVVCGSGPLLLRNQGHGKFSIKSDAFRFARPPAGTFTGAAVADYDRDGLLDIYFCVYSYYLGLDQYHYPAPYFDARNGPPNYLFHNQGNSTFEDRTEAAGLRVDNDRYSFACAWGDANGDGSPDLYVANDFGRSNFYRNLGDGTFRAASAEAGVEDPGAGMSACWFDFDNDGKQDIYVANMWSAAGMRVSEQENFQPQAPEPVRELYRRHARGNSLYQNQGHGKFHNVGAAAGVAMGRWAWSSDSWDFDHDGYPDLYIANGYISGPAPLGGERRDLSSFFWRQVVGKSPEEATSSARYERGWNAINELIRSDATWNGDERNAFYVNNHDGTFSEASGAAGLDLRDDSRSFALADLDGDGRLEVILKNRSGPQLRIFHNAMKHIGGSLAFRLRGTKSNRDAIGAALTVEAGTHRQTKYLQAGSGFLSQHTKEVFFGVGDFQGTVRATVRWPSGQTQVFENLPVNHRVEIEEGARDFVAKSFATPPSYALARPSENPEVLPSSIETWLIDPLTAPEFSLPDLAGNQRELRSFRGNAVLLHFWATSSPASLDHLRSLVKSQPTFRSTGLRVVAVNLDEPGAQAQQVPSTVAKLGVSFPVLLATPELAGVYNIVYRYLFDRRRDLAIPSSFLIDPTGMIVKLYQGVVGPERMAEDWKRMPGTAADRLQKALPFAGTLYQGEFKRNDFTYGVAFFQRGYLEQAAASFQNVIAAKPNEPEAYYNLGTLYLRRNDFPGARSNLEQAVKLRPDYPEAWNNLGMIAAQQGQTEEGTRHFQKSLQLRPDYAIALLNLGNLYRRQGNLKEAETLLGRALELEPENPEASYSLGMLYARQERLDRASESLERAVSLRPDYPDALNNLGVLFVREQKYPEAKQKFETCIRVAPNYDQAYLNLARLYVVLNEKEKAKQILQALLREQPQHKMAQQALEMLN